MGEIDFMSEGFSYRLACDRLALDGSGELLMVSFAAPASAAKAVAAALFSEVKLSMRLKDFAWKQGYHSRALTCPAGYVQHRHHLGYGTWHYVLVAKRPGFLPCISEDALWREVQTERFTVPVLRAWMPWLKRRLLHVGLLDPCDTVACEAGVLLASDKELEEVVGDGLREGKATIPERRTA